MAGHEGRGPAQSVLGHGQFQIGQPRQQGVDTGVRDRPADVLAGALVGAAAEGQVRAVAVDGHRLVGTYLGIDVPGREAQQQHVPGVDVHPGELGVAGGPAAQDRRERGLVPQDLFERVGQGHVTAGEVRAEALVGEDQAQRVRHEVGGRLERRDHHQPQVLHDLFVAQRRRVLQHPGSEVPAGHHPLGRDEFPQGGRDVLVAGDGRRGAPDHVAGGLDEPRSVRVRSPDQLGHDEHRQRFGEVGDEIAPPGLGETVDQLVGEALDVPPYAAPVEALEGVGERPAQPLVLGAVDEVAHRLPRGHRGQRMVRGDVALLHVPPAPRVPGEPGRRTRHVQVLAVAEHQPGRQVALYEDGGHRAVLGTQLLVQPHRIGLGLGAVEPVCGAARRRSGSCGERGGAHDASGVTARECR